MSLPYQNASLPIPARVADLLARMTPEEKLAQLSAAWFLEVSEGELFSPETAFSATKAQARLQHGVGEITALASRSAFSPERMARLANEVQAFLVQNTRLGIPAIFHDECCSGFMAPGATTFPQSIGLASTWQPELIEAMMTVARQQMRAVGTRQGLAPELDICREPRWGRVEETFGEDPYLAASMGVAYTRGLQSADLQDGVIATGKHFAAHGIPEGGLNWAPVRVGEREWREVYLYPFEAAVRQAGLGAIMNAYHEIDGLPCAASRQLLTDILRDEWGFTGIVVADYNAVAMLAEYHHIAADKGEAAALALQAGLDVELPGTDCYGQPLRERLAAGKLDPALVDQAVQRVLALKFRLGLFEKPFVDAERAAQAFQQPAQIALARQIAQQSLVLLKNEGGLLPLRPDLTSIAVIGPNADAVRSMVGDYSYAAFSSLLEGGDLPPEKSHFPARFPATMISVLEAIRRQVSLSTTVHYAPGCPLNDSSQEGGDIRGDTRGDIRGDIRFAEAVELAQRSEVVILVMGGKSGLNQDCTCGELRDRARLGLPGVQEALVQAICDTGKPVVLVLLDGRPAAIPHLVERLPAVLEAWLPGQEGGPAVADVLFGKVNPGGKLPITFPRAANQLPMYYGRKPSGGRSYNFEDYVDLSAKPLFPFGHGLSYTQFEYRNLRLSAPQIDPLGSLSIALDIQNSGSCCGDEVVQLYVHDVLASLTRPVKELKGFRRLTLQPGETRTLAFTLSAAQLAFYNRSMQFVVEPGQFEVMLGSSSADIRLNGSFEVVGAVTPIQDKVFFSQSTVQ